jgi:hypothetical protein
MNDAIESAPSQARSRRRRRRRPDVYRPQDTKLLAELGALGDPTLDRPELRLMRAVLADGLRSLVSALTRGSRRALLRAQDDLHWLTNRDRRELFSFEVICDALDLDSDRLRARILASSPTPVAMPVPAAASASMRGPSAGPGVRRSAMTRAA